MNGVDPARQARRERDISHDAMKKNNEANEKRLAEMKARNEHVEQKQLETFKADKAQIEKNYQKQLGHFNEKTQETLNDKADEHTKTLNKERDFFVKDSEGKRLEFDKRLNDITKSYRGAFKHERDHHKDVSEFQKESYNSKLDNSSKKSAELLSQNQQKMKETNEKQKSQYNKERDQLVQSQEDYVKNVMHDSAKERVDLKDRITKDITKTKEVAERDRNLTREYNENNLNTLKLSADHRNKVLAHEYSSNAHEQTERDKLETLKNNRENNEKLVEQRTKFENELRNIEIQKNRSETGSGDLAKVLSSQKGLNEKINLEKKLDTVNAKLKEAQTTYQNRAEFEQNNHNQTLKSQNVGAAAHLEKTVNNVNAQKLLTIAEAKDKNQKLLDNMTFINKQERADYEQQLNKERTGSKERLTRLKEDFNTSIKLLEDKNTLMMVEVNKNAKNDKFDFIKKMTENRDREQHEMKVEFRKLLDGTIGDYEKRILDYQRDNELLTLTMDQKVQTIADHSAKQMATQLKEFNAQRTTDQRTQALTLEQKSNEYKNTIAQVTTAFQKKIDKLQVSTDLKLKLLTSDYENKLKDLRTSNNLEMSQKNITHAVENERLKQDFAAEKARIVAQFENQIEEMKKGQQAQLDQMKDFKRLS